MNHGIGSLQFGYRIFYPVEEGKLIQRYRLILLVSFLDIIFITTEASTN